MTRKPSFQFDDVLIPGWNYSTEHRNVFICKHHQFEVLTDPNIYLQMKNFFSRRDLLGNANCDDSHPGTLINNRSIVFFSQTTRQTFFSSVLAPPKSTETSKIDDNAL